MAVEVHTSPARDIDAGRLSETLRDEDEAELCAATGLDPLTVMLHGVRQSSEAWAVRFNGDIAMLWGITNPSAIAGASGWLLTSRIVERYPVAFWKYCLRELPKLLERFGALWNFIDVRHEKAIRWATRLGFRLDEPAPYGRMGLPFRRFVVSRRDLECALLR